MEISRWVVWWCPSAPGVSPAALRFLMQALKEPGSPKPCLADPEGPLVSLVMVGVRSFSDCCDVKCPCWWEGGEKGPPIIVTPYHCECYQTPQKAESLESITHTVDHFPELSVLHEPPAHESWRQRPSQKICGASSPS